MAEDIRKAILDALTKYGPAEQLGSADEMEADLDQHISTASIHSSISSDLNLRHRLVSQGRILEENTVNHYYYCLIQLHGLFAPEALVVTIRDGTEIILGAFANDGSRSKRRSVQAIEQVKAALLQQ